jgi:hypothetical protein
VHSKSIILFFICLLTASLLKAEHRSPEAACTQQVMEAIHACSLHDVLHAPTLTPENISHELPEPAARRNRTRFRAVSQYHLVSVNKTVDPSPFTVPVITDPIRTVNQALMPPFYYVFLFRLKPF